MMQESCLSPVWTSFEILLNRFRPIIYAFFTENARWKYKKNRYPLFFVCLAQFCSPFFVIITEEKKNRCFCAVKCRKGKRKLAQNRAIIREFSLAFSQIRAETGKVLNVFERMRPKRPFSGKSGRQILRRDLRTCGTVCGKPENKDEKKQTLHAVIPVLKYKLHILKFRAIRKGSENL